MGYCQDWEDDYEEPDESCGPVKSGSEETTEGPKPVKGGSDD